MSDKKDQVVDLNEHKQKKIANFTATEENYEQAVEMALDQINETIDERDVRGFIGVMFTADGEPEVVHAGYLDLIKTVGTLEFVKNEMMNHVYLPEHFKTFEELDNDPDSEPSE